MKTLTSLTLLFVICNISLSSCKKKIYGCMDQKATNTSKFATIDDGSCTYPIPEPENVQIEYFSLTFNPGDYVIDYTPNIPFENGDLIVLEQKFALSLTEEFWISMPYTSDNTTFYFSYENYNGKIKVFLRDNTTNQPYAWTNSSTFDFRLAVIKWNGIIPLQEFSLDAYTEK